MKQGAAFSVRMPTERFEKLRRIASGEGLSMNEVLNRLVDSVPTKQQVVETYDLSAARLDPVMRLGGRELKPPTVVENVLQ